MLYTTIGVKLKSLYFRAQKYLQNISWMMFEKMLTMGIAFAVSVFLARYLGPDLYGRLNYSISLVSLFSIAGHVGLSGLIVRELVQSAGNKNEIMGTSFTLKSLGYLIGFFGLVIFSFVSEEWLSTDFWLLIIIAASLLFKPFDVIDFWFQSTLQAKYTTLSRSFAIIVSAILNVLFVVLSASILFFAAVITIRSLIVAGTLIAFSYISTNVEIRSWQFSKDKALSFMAQGWVIFVGTLFATIYLKIDKIMLKWYAGAEDVGVYAVAANLSEAWYFVPTAIVASFFPMLVKLKKTNSALYEARLQQLFDLLFSIAFVIAIVVNFVSQPVIEMLFGQAYEQAGTILNIHIWAAPFIFMRAVFSKWILIEDALIFSAITQGTGALINVLINLLLIPSYGGVGAAYATFISYTVASYLSLLFHKKTLVLFVMMSKSFFIPLRYLRKNRRINADI